MEYFRINRYNIYKGLERVGILWKGKLFPSLKQIVYYEKEQRY